MCGGVYRGDQLYRNSRGLLLIVEFSAPDALCIAGSFCRECRSFFRTDRLAASLARFRVQFEVRKLWGDLWGPSVVLGSKREDTAEKTGNPLGVRGVGLSCFLDTCRLLMNTTIKLFR